MLRLRRFAVVVAAGERPGRCVGRGDVRAGASAPRAHAGARATADRSARRGDQTAAQPDSCRRRRCGRDRRQRPDADRPRHPGIVPGSVDRTSLDLTAEYDVALSLNFGSRAFSVDSPMTVRNDSGGPIDRLELNTIAARLGGDEARDGHGRRKAVKATVDDQTIIVPLGGILAAASRSRSGSATRRRSAARSAGSNWMFTRANGIIDAYRWIPWVSRRLAFDRPNHGDPFETPVTPRVRVAITSDRDLVFATTGERIAVSGLRQTFEASNVRDFVFAAAPDYKTISTTVGDNVIRVYYRPGAPAAAILAAAKHAIATMEPLVGRTRIGRTTLPRPPAASGWRRPA